MSRNRRGFTLIELLVVILIIGILVSLAMPRFASTRDKAALASVRSDVRNAETAEEAYFVDAGRYGTLSELQNYTNFNVAIGNVISIAAAPAGYTINVSNATITAGATGCSVQVGAGAPSTADSKIVCP
ncbi:MAG TPA: prepilin-type N-terminal cleavage/methylation domain-containing protein [Gemmatimonadales bacterium]|jgi:prepilin-type N-terminal cleavage/methylation domain-containing protein